VPEDPAARIEYAAYLDARGMKREAVHELRRLTDPDQSAGTAPPPLPVVRRAFRLLARIHEDYQEPEEALQVRLRAVERFPDDIGQRMGLARLYEEMGIPYRAAEEYRKVLRLDPLQAAARKRLRVLGADS